MEDNKPHPELYVKLHKNSVDISNMDFGDWKVLGYLGKSMWECQCSCGVIKAIDGRSLRKGITTSCGHSTKKYQDLIGKKFGEWTVNKHLGSDGKRHYWECECSCGKIMKLDSFTLTSGNSTSCGHSKLIDITGEQFGDWKVIKYAGNKKWECECLCGEKREVSGKDLRSGKSTSCGHIVTNDGNIIPKKYSPNLVRFSGDLTGQQIFDWKVLYYNGNGKYMCRCTCGVEREIITHRLVYGLAKSCGHDTSAFKDITNMRFGQLVALRYKGNHIWECRCDCGNIYETSGYSLRSHKTVNCNNTIHRLSEDLTGKTFGELYVNKYIGNNTWECKCSCSNIVNVLGTNLRNGNTKSCGCKTQDMRMKALMNSGYLQKREDWQFEVIRSKDSFIKYITSFDDKQTPLELSQYLGIGIGRILDYIHIYQVEELINLNPSISKAEKDIYTYVCELIGKDKVVQSDKSILDSKEIDIYVPSKNLAIEFNGIYWHSSKMKPKNYHQDKTIQCATKGIRLIHIFEYEWEDEVQRNKIKRLLNEILLNNSTIIFAKNTSIVEIETSEAIQFENDNHLQNGIQSKINIALKHNNEIIGLMTFSKPRFNTDFEYELIRLCYKQGINIIGGSEKMFKYFINKYSPKSVVSYCNIAKFSGSVYLKLGFKASRLSITSPSYVWVNGKDVLSRFKTQKNTLLELNLGSEDESESDIMERLGYLKIYDSGNLRFEWREGDN